jgi:hypothetical protein
MESEMVDPDAPLPEDILPPEIVPLAERFADEGVPIRAMARAFKQTTDAVREAVAEAIYHGRIVQMPKDDWPVGQSRDDRTPSFMRQNRMDDENLLFSCQRLFKMTRLQASLLTALINRNEVSKDTLHQIIEGRRPPGREETDLKMVDVVICHLRKRLKPFNLKIVTLWASGYYIEPAQRRQILEMVNDHVLGKTTKDALAAATGSDGPQEKASQAAG